MKKIKFLAMVACTVCLAACSKGGDSDGITLKIEPQLGDMGKFITVSDQEVNVKLVDEKEDGSDIKKIASSIALQVKQDVASDYGFDLDATVLDKDHVEIGELPGYDVESKDDYDNGDLHYTLTSGTVRGEMSGIKKANEWAAADQEKWDKIAKEGMYISVKPRWDSDKFAAYSGSSENNKSGDIDSETSADESTDESLDSSDSGSEDWDALLDSYDEYVTKYVSYAKKAAKGDASALAEYPSLMEKAQEFSDKMSGAQGEMSPSQWSRYMTITNKMSKAATDIR